MTSIVRIGGRSNSELMVGPHRFISARHINTRLHGGQGLSLVPPYTRGSDSLHTFTSRNCLTFTPTYGIYSKDSAGFPSYNILLQ
jgi:hypothetical protein